MFWKTLHGLDELDHHSIFGPEAVQIYSLVNAVPGNLSTRHKWTVFRASGVTVKMHLNLRTVSPKA